MEITNEQLERFKKLCKKRGKKMTDVEALIQAQALIRFLGITVIPFEPPEEK